MKPANDNVADPVDIHGDLLTRLKWQSRFGWAVAAVLLAVLITQSMIRAAMPVPFAAVDENGQVMGEVIFDEPRLRMPEEVLADMKGFVRRCVSINKQTIWEDAAICLSHMEQSLSDAQLEIYQTSGYLTRVSEVGCDRVDFRFDDEQTGLTQHQPGDYFAEGQLAGTATCTDDPKNPIPQDFKLQISVKLVSRTESKPLGIEVIKYADI